MLRMNAVYPGMLSFAERIWRGGGQPGWIAHIDHGDSAAFREFEERLVAHQDRYFTGIEFPYVAQADINWQLIGPFDNKGDLKKEFWPETDSLRCKADSRCSSPTANKFSLFCAALAYLLTQLRKFFTQWNDSGKES